MYNLLSSRTTLKQEETCLDEEIFSHPIIECPIVVLAQLMCLENIMKDRYIELWHQVQTTHTELRKRGTNSAFSRLSNSKPFHYQRLLKVRGEQTTFLQEFSFLWVTGVPISLPKVWDNTSNKSNVQPNPWKIKL